MTKTLGVRQKIGSRTCQGLNRRLAIRSEAVRWCSAASGTPASHAAPAWISLVCDTVRQAQSVPAPRARCFFQGQRPLATPPRQWRSLRLARRLCPTSKAFPAYSASVRSIASAREARRAPALAGAMPHRADKRLQRFPDAVCTPRETRPPPLAIARNWRKPGPAPDEVRATRAAGAAPPDILSRLAAFGAGQNSFPRAPDARARNPDEWSASCQSRPWIAGRLRGRGNTTNPDRPGAVRAPL